MSAPIRQLLIAHVLYRFDVGGLENGVVNLVNRLPRDRFRHAIVALTEVTDFRHRVERDDVQYVSLHKTPGHGMKLWPALHRTFRQMRPDIVHTRNLAALEATVPAWSARVAARVHGEHGWDVSDLDGSNRAHRATRRLYRPFVSQYIALSRHLEHYLHEAIGVASSRVTQIYNGVDTARFQPVRERRGIDGSPFNDPDLCVVGTVGRLAEVKDQAALIRSLSRLHRSHAGAARRLRLAIVGDGPCRAELGAIARSEGVEDAVWLPGSRDDIADVMSGFDVFALPSLAEGISNTVLEAMASARPVLATAVGGNVELVEEGVTGTLVPPADPAALDAAVLRYFATPGLATAHGASGRSAVLQRFSLDRMVADYAALYERVAGISSSARGEPVHGTSLETRAGY